MNKNADLLKNCVESRLNFLNKGYYNKVSDKLNEYIYEGQKDTKDKETIYNIVDSGCGPGFYMHQLKLYLNSKGINNDNICGFDISEEAINLAKKTFKDISFFYGDVNSIPLPDKSQNAIVCVFSYKNYKEYNRILKDNGKVYIVTSGGKNHFKEILSKFGIEKEKDFKKMENEFKSANFRENNREFLEYQINLKTNEDILEIIDTIPYHLEFPQEKLNYFKNLNNLDLTASFCFLEIEKVKDI